jgi:mono/diheme cytochrome c family protein
LLLPAFIGSAVLLLALTLLTIVARGPYTHSNLNAAYDPGYARTTQMFLGTPIPLPGGMLAVPRASDPVQLGKQLFVVDGCASCHGLDAKSGIIGPPIAGKKVDELRLKTHVGPLGMPAYAEGALSDADLAAIAAYLGTLGK